MMNFKLSCLGIPVSWNQSCDPVSQVVGPVTYVRGNWKFRVQYTDSTCYKHFTSCLLTTSPRVVPGIDGMSWTLYLLGLHHQKTDFHLKPNSKHVRNQRSPIFERLHQHHFQSLGHLGFPALLQALEHERLHQDEPPVYEPGAGSVEGSIHAE